MTASNATTSIPSAVPIPIPICALSLVSEESALGSDRVTPAGRVVLLMVVVRGRPAAVAVAGSESTVILKKDPVLEASLSCVPSTR